MEMLSGPCLSEVLWSLSIVDPMPLFCSGTSLSLSLLQHLTTCSLFYHRYLVYSSCLWFPVINMVEHFFQKFKLDSIYVCKALFSQVGNPKWTGHAPCLQQIHYLVWLCILFCLCLEGDGKPHILFLFPWWQKVIDGLEHSLLSLALNQIKDHHIRMILDKRQ